MPAVLSSQTFLLGGNRASSTARPQRLRQPGDVGGDAPSLVAGEEVAAERVARLVLEIKSRPIAHIIDANLGDPIAHELKRQFEGCLPADGTIAALVAPLGIRHFPSAAPNKVTLSER
jgi:hypothetical protein